MCCFVFGCHRRYVGARSDWEFAVALMRVSRPLHLEVELKCKKCPRATVHQIRERLAHDSTSRTHTHSRICYYTTVGVGPGRYAEPVTSDDVSPSGVSVCAAKKHVHSRQTEWDSGEVRSYHSSQVMCVTIGPLRHSFACNSDGSRKHYCARQCWCAGIRGEPRCRRRRRRCQPLHIDTHIMSDKGNDF